MRYPLLRLNVTKFLTIVLVIGILTSIISANWSDGELIRPNAWMFIVEIVSAIWSLDLSAEFLKIAIDATGTTIGYAASGLSLAVLFALPLGILASGTLFRSLVVRVVGMLSIRSVLALLRSIHELVWAWLIIVAIGFSPAAAILAIAIPYSAILARIYADLLNDVPQEPMAALRASGANEFKVLLYGRLPMALPNMVSYTFYRFECAIRSAAIFSFVGVGGLGYQIQLSLDDLRFEQVWTLLAFLVLLIALVDGWSNLVRSKLLR